MSWDGKKEVHEMVLPKLDKSYTEACVIEGFEERGTQKLFVHTDKNSKRKRRAPLMDADWELREGLCWSLQVRCDWTCSLTLFPLLIVSILTAALVVVVAGWYDELLAGLMARVSYTGEEMDHEGLLLGSGPSGSSRLEDAETDDGGRRYGIRALPANRELLTWKSEARDLARASLHPPIVELTNILILGRLFPPYTGPPSRH